MKGDIFRTKSKLVDVELALVVQFWTIIMFTKYYYMIVCLLETTSRPPRVGDDDSESYTSDIGGE